MYSHCGSVEWKSSENYSTYCKQPTRVPHSHFFLYEIFISLPMGSPLNVRPLRKKMLVFFVFFFTRACIGSWRNKNGLQWRHSSSGCGNGLASYAGGRKNTPSSFMLQKSPVNLQMRGLYDIPLAGAKGGVTLRQRESIP